MDRRTIEAQELDEKTQDPAFWSDPKAAEATMKKVREVKGWLNGYKEAAQAYDIQSVRLFDPQGRLVHTEECDRADRVDLDFQGYAQGVYTISILSKGKNVSRKVMY